MTRQLHVLIGVVALAAATRASADITLYRGEGFRGRAVTSVHGIRDLQNSPLAAPAGAAVVDSGAWQVCDGPQFSGNCVVLLVGSYDSVRSMGLDRGVASARAARQHTEYRQVPPPLAEPTYEYRQRPHELQASAATYIRSLAGWYAEGDIHDCAQEDL